MSAPQGHSDIAAQTEDATIHPPQDLPASQIPDPGGDTVAREEDPDRVNLPEEGSPEERLFWASQYAEGQGSLIPRDLDPLGPDLQLPRYHLQLLQFQDAHKCPRQHECPPRSCPDHLENVQQAQQE